MTSTTFKLPIQYGDAAVTTAEALNAEVNRVVGNVVSQVELGGMGLSLIGQADLSSGSFPSGSSKGDYWIATAGVVDGVSFIDGDKVVSLLDGASTSVYEGNWAKIPSSKPEKEFTTQAQLIAATLDVGDIATVSPYRYVIKPSGTSGGDVVLGDGKKAFEIGPHFSSGTVMQASYDAGLLSIYPAEVVFLADGVGFTLVDDGSGGQIFQSVLANYVEAAAAAAVSVLVWHDWSNESDLTPAILSAVQAIKDGGVPSRSVYIPDHSSYYHGGWTLSGETLVDVSNITFGIYGDIYSTNETQENHTLLFAPTNEGTPSTFLDRVTVIGRRGVIVDGNASEKNFVGADSLTITNSGSGYDDGDYVISGTGGGGSGFSGVVTVSGGEVISTVITARGYGYTSAPDIDLSNLTGGTDASITSTVGEVHPVVGALDNFGAMRFNSVKNLYVYGIHAKNGMMDSMSTKRCPGHVIECCTFSDAKWDNGFTATTDLADYTEDDTKTWGGGVVRDCVAFDNNDFGMTSYNASGHWFVNCTSYENDSGFSYEHQFGVNDGSKDYHGGFINSRGHSNLDRGFYVDASGVTIDDTCETWGNRGTTADQTDHLHEHGVLVSSVIRGYVGGRHERNGRCGIALFNGEANDMQVTINATCAMNDWHGVYAREQSRLTITDSSRIIGNGTDPSAVSGYVGRGVFAASTSMAMTGKGSLVVNGAEISDNASRAVEVEGYGRAVVRNVWGENNFADTGSSGAAIRLDKTGVAVCEGAYLNDTSGRQTFIVEITGDVDDGYETGTRGDGSVGLVSNFATSARTSTKPTSLTVSDTWVVSDLYTGTRDSITLSAPGVDVGDYVSVSFDGDIGLRVPTALVVSAGNIVVYLANYTSSTISSQTFTVRAQVTQRNAR